MMHIININIRKLKYTRKFEYNIKILANSRRNVLLR